MGDKAGWVGKQDMDMDRESIREQRRFCRETRGGSFGLLSGAWAQTL
jgi:hypothetical protein